MLKLSLLPTEYLTINGNIVVQLTRVAGGRAYVAIDAARDIPIVRGTVLEREGGKRPDCLEPPARKRMKPQRDLVFRWNDDRDRAVRKMQQVIDHLEQSGAADEAKVLRTQLNCLLPTLWEEELSTKN